MGLRAVKLVHLVLVLAWVDEAKRRLLVRLLEEPVQGLDVVLMLLLHLHLLLLLTLLLHHHHLHRTYSRCRYSGCRCGWIDHLLSRVRCLERLLTVTAVEHLVLQVTLVLAIHRCFLASWCVLKIYKRLEKKVSICLLFDFSRQIVRNLALLLNAS